MTTTPPEWAYCGPPEPPTPPPPEPPKPPSPPPDEDREGCGRLPTEGSLPPSCSITNSSLEASGVAPPTGSTCGVGDLFFYQITTSLTNPTYTLLNLPPGLSVSPTGLISGRPGEAGVFNVTIYATDGNCRAHANLVITITPAPAEDLDIFPPETQSTTLTITGREFNYNNVYTVPVQAIPNQIVRFSASGQAVVLHIYQRLYGIFMDVSVMASGNNVVTILGGVLCEDRNLIVRSMYFNFNGDFAFLDTLGTSNPHYTELGTRYLLVYLEPPATTGVTPTTGMVTTTGIGLTMVTGTMTGS